MIGRIQRALERPHLGRSVGISPALPELGRAAGWKPGRACYIENLAGENFKIAEGGGFKWLESASLAHLPGIVHAFSTRAAPGDASADFTRGDDAALAQSTRANFLRALGAGEFTLAEVRQFHSARVFQVARPGGRRLEFLHASSAVPVAFLDAPPEGDALVTDVPGVLLGVRTADCMPVLIGGEARPAIAAVHAGWRGALEGVIGNALAEMARRFGSKCEDLSAAIGPAIGGCCYEVGDEVFDAFQRRFTGAERFFGASGSPGDSPPHGRRGQRGGAASRWHLNLAAVARAQLESGGLKPASISEAGACTACRADLFYSYRREGPRAGRMLSVIGIRPDGVPSG